MGKVIRVGVTGGIGSGKSTVCRVFACLGIPVYYADERARWLTENDPDIRAEVITLLGKEAYTKDGEYNTRFVASKVFSDKSLLDSLNRVIHPRVRLDTKRWVEEHQDSPYVVKEAAIMTRAGEESGLDYVVGVVSPEPLRIARVLTRDLHRTYEQVAAIIANQVSEERLRYIADFIVANDEKELIIPQVLRIHDEMIRKG